MRYGHLPLVALALAGLLVGCSGVDQSKAEQTGQNIKTETRQVGHEASRDLEEGAMTLRVKTALETSRELHGATIHVTSEAHQVVLKGSVLNEQQKTVAGQIAKDTVGSGIQVVNDLGLEKRAEKAR